MVPNTLIERLTNVMLGFAGVRSGIRELYFVFYDHC